MTLIPEVFCLGSFGERLFGLMGRQSLGTNRAVFLSPCRCVHTGFMRFPLDLIFLSRDWRVARLFHDVAPWRIRGCLAGGWGVLELEAGWFSRNSLRSGDRVDLVGFGAG